jgi:hypothetical protein
MRPQSAEFEPRVPILIVAGTLRGVHAIAEGVGWSTSAPPAIGEPIQLVTGGAPDKRPVPVFEPAERKT